MKTRSGFERAIQKDFGVIPVSMRACAGDAQGVGGLLHRQPSEISQLDQLGLAQVFSGEFLKRLAECKNLIGVLLGRRDIVIQRHAPQITRMFGTLLSACIVDEDAPHRLSGGAEEMSAALPLLFVVEQFEIGFMDQCRGLQRLTGLLVGQPPCR